MSETSANLSLPYLQAAQAQKHVTHNAALEILDLTAQLSVQAFGATTPPLSPTEGHVWALGAGASGDWAGHGGELAGWSNGGWVFVTPRPGWRAAQGIDLRLWDGSAWVAPSVVPDLQNLPGVGINTTSDVTNKLAVASEAVLFSHAGAGHQVKVNKAAAGDTASLLFQTGWSGRAEMGLAGNDDWSLKVSPDGSGWTTALMANRTTGLVTLSNGLSVAGSLTLPAGGVARAALANGAARSVLGRSAGTAIQLVAKEGDMVTLRLPSSEMRLVRAECRATIGTISNAEHQNVKIGKAGRNRHKGKRPQTRGIAMNPVDHPHGGGEAHKTPGGHPVTPWGKPTLGYRTRKKGKQSDRYIVRGRRRGKKKGR